MKDAEANRYSDMLTTYSVFSVIIQEFGLNFIVFRCF